MGKSGKMTFLSQCQVPSVGGFHFSGIAQKYSAWDFPCLFGSMLCNNFSQGQIHTKGLAKLGHNMIAR